MSGISKWMDDQVSIKPTLHRAFFRERVNPRTQVDQQVRVRVRISCESMHRHSHQVRVTELGLRLGVSPRTGVHQGCATLTSTLMTECTDVFHRKKTFVWQIGMLIGPCDAMSRWHRYAFTGRDDAKVLNITRSGAKLVFSVDGLVRTEVDAAALRICEFTWFIVYTT